MHIEVLYEISKQRYHLEDTEDCNKTVDFTHLTLQSASQAVSQPLTRSKGYSRSWSHSHIN